MSTGGSVSAVAFAPEPVIGEGIKPIASMNEAINRPAKNVPAITAAHIMFFLMRRNSFRGRSFGMATAFYSLLSAPPPFRFVFKSFAVDFAQDQARGFGVRLDPTKQQLPVKLCRRAGLMVDDCPSAGKLLYAFKS